MNTRFARLGEDVYKRQSELTGEEFRLYCIIFFHSFFDSGICRKNLRQLSGIYSLSYTHTTERYKVLEKLLWCETAKRGIRPLVGLKVPVFGTSEVEMFRKPEHDSSENRNINIPKTGTSEGEMFRKPELVYKEYKEPLKEKNIETAAAEKIAAATTEIKNGHLSKFSREEILRYLDIRIKSGEEIPTPHKLANWMYQTGEYDVFIRAILYPETESEEIAEDFKEKERRESLTMLLELQEIGANIEESAKFFAPEDWSWLMEELPKWRIDKPKS